METGNLITALRWREDVESGEMITSKGYQKNHLNLPRSGGLISQGDLDAICDVANRWWLLCGSDLRITNSMGEIIPGFAKK